MYTIGENSASFGKIKDSGVKDINIEKFLLPMSIRPFAEELLEDPFFLYNGGSSTLNDCGPAASFDVSHPIKRLQCWARNIKNLCLV